MSWKETLIVDGRVTTECRCTDPDRYGHTDPTCGLYCQHCNYDWHRCPDCGTVADHAETQCGDCVDAERARNEYDLGL